MLELLQEQFTLERLNEQFYRALASAAEMVNWSGAAKFFYDAADDEQSHAKRIRDYLIARGIQPVFEMIDVIPVIDGNDYRGMFNLALEREKLTTQSLRDKYAAEKDPQTIALLISSQGDWPGFLQEQTDSEKLLVDYIQMIDRLSPDGLIVFDTHLLED